MIRINIPLHENEAKVQYKNEILYTFSKKYFSVLARVSSRLWYLFFLICHSIVSNLLLRNGKAVTNRKYLIVNDLIVNLLSDDKIDDFRPHSLSINVEC